MFFSYFFTQFWLCIINWLFRILLSDNIDAKVVWFCRTCVCNTLLQYIFSYFISFKNPSGFVWGFFLEAYILNICNHDITHAAPVPGVWIFLVLCVLCHMYCACFKGDGTSFWLNGMFGFLSFLWKVLHSHRQDYRNVKCLFILKK